jgi:DNA-binding transcriptional regulator YdaS (Cro superfamily)
MKTNLKESIERAGGVATIAAHFGISPVSVYEWIKRGCVPADKCPEIEKLSHGEVKCEELNDQVDWPYLRATECPAPRRAKSRTPDAEPAPARQGRQPPSRKNVAELSTDQPPLYTVKPA